MPQQFTLLEQAGSHGLALLRRADQVHKSIKEQGGKLKLQTHAYFRVFFSVR
jgi:hypothetical protein